MIPGLDTLVPFLLGTPCACAFLTEHGLQPALRSRTVPHHGTSCASRSPRLRPVSFVSSPSPLLPLFFHVPHSTFLILILSLSLQLEKAQTGEEKAFRGNVAAGRGPANHLANIRLFDSPEGTEPRVTLSAPPPLPSSSHPLFYLSVLPPSLTPSSSSFLSNFLRLSTTPAMSNLECVARRSGTATRQRGARTARRCGSSSSSSASRTKSRRST
eukprot:3916409-Rhodomonas_salina.1